MPKRWVLHGLDPAAGQNLAAIMGLPGLLGKVLVARGYSSNESASKFLESSLEECHSPWDLNGMRPAVDRVVQALRRRERIVVYGDYDVDGVTSTTILMKLLGLLGGQVDFYIPDRLKEGYGPNIAAFEKLRREGAGLVITVDCGMTSHLEVEAARNAGLDVIITDHHVPGPLIPAAVAVINPKISPEYPYDMLAGVGVAYKFAQALLEDLAENRKDEFLDNMLEMVALGTVCDVAPLNGENRALVAAGINRLRRGRWLGLRSLAARAGIPSDAIDSGSLGFVLGPRLNAGGRLGDASLGVRLMLTKDRDESFSIAGYLDEENSKRQVVEKEVVAAALRLAEERVDKGDKILVLWDAGWHPGVIGLAASRVQERCGRPTLIFSVEGNSARGSGRSRRPFHLVRALESCAHILDKFGGHEFAAGLTLPSRSLEAFRERMNAFAADLSAEDLVPEIDIDCEAALTEIDATFLKHMDRVQPFGLKNPRPVFVARKCRILPGTRAVGAGGEHLKLVVGQGPIVLGGIAFRQAESFKSIDVSRPVDLVFSPGWNDYQGSRSVQLEVKDMAQAI